VDRVMAWVWAGALGSQMVKKPSPCPPQTPLDTPLVACARPRRTVAQAKTTALGFSGKK